MILIGIERPFAGFIRVNESVVVGGMEDPTDLRGVFVRKLDLDIVA